MERYIAYAVSCGVKIMLIYLLIGAGFILSNGWVTAAQNIVFSAQPATDALDIAAAAIIFLMICWNAPKLAAAMLGGSPALSGGDAVATGGALIGGAVAVAGLAAGGVALGAKLLAAKGGAMSVSQAAGMGAGGGSGASGLAAGVGVGSGGGGRGGGGTATPSNGGQSGGGASEGPANQAAPPPFAGTSQGQTSQSDSTASPSQGSAPVATEPAPASSGPSSPGATGSSAPMSSSGADPRADESKLRAARASSFAKGTIYAGHAVNQLRSAVPSDAAPPATPPPLHNEGHE